MGDSNVVVDICLQVDSWVMKQGSFEVSYGRRVVMTVIVSKASSVVDKGVFMVEFKCRCKVLNCPLEMLQLHLDTTALN